MGFFSFLFSKHKILRTTEEAETFRKVFREDEELFLRVGKSGELKRYRELEEYVNSPLFRQRRKEIEQLSYKGSKYYEAERQYKALLKSRKLQSYQVIHDSQELKGYEKVKSGADYEEYMKLKVIVKSVGFDKKLHAVEYNAYREIVRSPKIAALIKFENLRQYKEYCEMRSSGLPEKFEELSAFIQSEDFKENRKYLLDKNRYITTEDYKLLREYEGLKKKPEIMKYNALINDPYFNSMRKWQLMFEDDFGQGQLDVMKWITRYYAGERFLNDTYGVGEDVQLYTADNISFGQSSVCLNFRQESIIGKYWDNRFGIRERKYEYTSAMISTASSFRQRYGRFEAKIRLNRAEVASCFWMLGDTDVPHIEVMRCIAEGVGTGYVSNKRGEVVSQSDLVKNISLGNDYYIFTLEWTEDRMVWMINDLVVREVKENIPDVPMYIVFSLGATEKPGNKSLPARMEIDWVRAYRLKS